MDNKFCSGLMRREASAAKGTLGDVGTSDSGRRARSAPRTRWARLSSVILLTAAYGCGSSGSDFGTAGTTGMPGGGTPGSEGGSAPTAGNGMGGSAPVGGSMSTGGTGNEGNIPGGGASPMGGTSPMGGNSTGGTPPTAGTGGTPPSGGTGGTPPQGPVCPKPMGQICHEFFANDNARNVINYVNEFDASGKSNWSKPVNDTGVNSPRQVDMVDNAMGAPFAGSATPKAILISVNKGYQEYHPVTGARLVNVVLPGNPDIRGAVRLPDGNTALAVGNNLMRVVTAGGATVQECTLPGTSANDSLRVLNRDPATGNFLFGRMRELIIMNPQCQEQWKAQLPDGAKAYALLPRPGGGVWATSGAPSTVIAYNQASMIVGQVGGKTVHPTLNLDFFSGFELLPNGNIVAANWLGHVGSPGADTAHLVEFTPDNKVVWTWGNQTLARQITNTLMLR